MVVFLKRTSTIVGGCFRAQHYNAQDRLPMTCFDETLACREASPVIKMSYSPQKREQKLACLCLSH